MGDRNLFVRKGGASQKSLGNTGSECMFKCRFRVFLLGLGFGFKFKVQFSGLGFVFEFWVKFQVVGLGVWFRFLG